MRRDRAGMTIIELMVALSIAGMLLLGGRSLLDQLARTQKTLGRSARATDRLSNATRTLYALAARADVRPDSVSRFVGDSAKASFRTWCEGRGGWLEPCDVSISVDVSSDSSSLVGQLGSGGSLKLARWPGEGALRYLDVSGPKDQWVSQWGRSIVPPAALALVVPGDTVVIPLVGR